MQKNIRNKIQETRYKQISNYNNQAPNGLVIGN